MIFKRILTFLGGFEAQICTVRLFHRVLNIYPVTSDNMNGMTYSKGLSELGNSGRNLAGNALFGFLVGFVTRKGFDAHNRKKMLEKYEQTGQIPKKKSMLMSILLVLLFGGFGLFYTAPRTALPLAFMELMMVPIFIGVLNLLFRPVVLFIAFVATLSYNKMILHLFGKYGS